MTPQAFILILVLAASVIGSGGLLIRSQIENRVAAELEAQAEKTRAELAEVRISRLEDLIKLEKERQEELVQELQAARDREATTTEVLEDRNRLDRLTQARPTLIERQARRATTKVWQEIEAESRD